MYSDGKGKRALRRIDRVGRVCYLSKRLDLHLTIGGGAIFAGGAVAFHCLLVAGGRGVGGGWLLQARWRPGRAALPRSRSATPLHRSPSFPSGLPAMLPNLRSVRRRFLPRMSGTWVTSSCLRCSVVVA